MKKKKPYSITLNLGGILHESEGDTMLEALQGLKRPDKMMSKAIMTIREGEKSKDMLVPLPRLKRFFFQNVGMQAIHAKYLSLGLK